MEKSKWSNPFYTPKLSAKICNKRYRRHILSSKHLQVSLKELVGKRLGCLCPNLDECHGNVLIELVHEFFLSESEMRAYILCHQYLFFKGQRSLLSICTGLHPMCITQAHSLSSYFIFPLAWPNSLPYYVPMHRLQP